MKYKHYIIDLDFVMGLFSYNPGNCKVEELWNSQYIVLQSSDFFSTYRVPLKYAIIAPVLSTGKTEIIFGFDPEAEYYVWDTIEKEGNLISYEKFIDKFSRALKPLKTNELPSFIKEKNS